MKYVNSVVRMMGLQCPKTEARCHGICDTIKISPCYKVMFFLKFPEVSPHFKTGR